MVSLCVDTVEDERSRHNRVKLLDERILDGRRLGVRGVDFFAMADETSHKDYYRGSQPSARVASHIVATLAHPLVSVFVGFILTGIVGWWLSTSYSEKQKTNERTQLAAETGIKAAQDFARTAYRRCTRSAMLCSALLRNADIDEIKVRKRDYDDAFAAWGTDIQANLIMIRTLTGQIRYERLQSPWKISWFRPSRRSTSVLRTLTMRESADARRMTFFTDATLLGRLKTRGTLATTSQMTCSRQH